MLRCIFDLILTAYNLYLLLYKYFSLSVRG